jgi:hypothetical protein
MAFQFPNPNLTPEFTGSNGITYVWDVGDGKWSIKGFSADFDDRYVNEEGGDTMEGQLVIDGPRKAGDDPINPNLVSSVKVLSIDNAQNSSLQLRHGGNAKIYIGPTDVAIASDIKFNRDAGSIVRTNDADLINIAREEVSYTGNIENEKNLVTKKYVDDADEELRQQIITIDEELESIVPSIERGQWTYEQAQNPFRPPAAGKYFLIKGITAADQIGLAQFTEDYTESTGAVFSATDHVGTNHTWSDVEDGKLIDLLDKPDPDGLFGTITEVNTAYHSSGAAIIMWDAIQSLGSPTNKQPYLTNVKIFETPTGGEASDFVKKSGDEMSGDLQFNTTQTEFNFDPADATAKVIFSNKKSDFYNPKTVQLYQPGDDESLVVDGHLRTKGDLRVEGRICYWDTTSQYSSNPDVGTRKAFIKLGYDSDPNNKTGVLGFTEHTDVKCLEWSLYHGVNLPLPGFSGNSSGFRIEGAVGNHYSDTTSTNNNGLLLHTYHNSGETDEIRYYGRITDPKHLATKEYADDGIAALLARIEELENNSSTGGGSMSRNVRIKLESSSSSAGFLKTNQIKTFSANDTVLYVNCYPIIFKPQGRINITEVGRGTSGPIWSFHITGVRNYTTNNDDEQIVELQVALEGSAASGGSYDINSGRELYVSLVDGAWDEGAILESTLKFKTSGSSSWARDGDDPVPNSGKIYKLDRSGNFTQSSYPSGAFVPADYMETELGFKYYGLTDDPSGKYGGDVAKGVVEATVNGVKGVKIWSESSIYYNYEIEIQISGMLLSYVGIT